MYLWLNAIYNDPTYKVSKKSAVVVLPQWGSYFTVQLSSRRLSGVWHCSKSRVNTVLHRLQDDGFITLCHKYGKCLVIGLNHYAEWVLGKAQSTLTDDNVEVDVLGRDPDPIVRSLNKEINRLAAIMKKKNCLRVNYLSELFRDTSDRLLEREYLVYGATRFWYVAMRLRRKMLISVNDCPQNRILLFLQSQAIFQLWRRLTRGSASYAQKNIMLSRRKKHCNSQYAENIYSA
ncbi:hypothetical protein A7X67_17245 [Clostridium sp. W14A]|nr:hypothetical protein A7X67_17245 [Clostridium sp. W14A]